VERLRSVEAIDENATAAIELANFSTKHVSHALKRIRRGACDALTGRR
jgi:hypothetical protein